MSRYRQVIVPTDAEPDETTIAVARGVAARLGTPVVVLSVVSPGLAETDEIELRQLAAGIAPDAESRMVVDDGRPTSAQLAEVAGEPGTLMCLRTHAQPAVLEAAFGSVSEEVIRASRSDVLVVGPNCRPDFAGTRMIIAVEPGPIDDSEYEAARDLAEALCLTPEYVTVVPVADDRGALDVADQARRERDPEVTPVTGDLLRRTVVSGSPPRVLSTLSENPDVAMIAMTTRSTGAFNRIVIGSTTLKTIRHAECPVLVHGPGNPQGHR